MERGNVLKDTPPHVPQQAHLCVCVYYHDAHYV